MRGCLTGGTSEKWAVRGSKDGSGTACGWKPQREAGRFHHGLRRAAAATVPSSIYDPPALLFLGAFSAWRWIGFLE
ncbi:hypothetical protein Hsar01_02566 [Haloferula sargassicola]|uniref:Uncharacterized protein n=1 Tax=Haloferula sargassicola TaxID=490096 RepID=A0ABP9URK5_9BACT